MTISANYPTPVYVNGYACNNCTQVAEAKKGVDPADPKAGPYGVDAESDPKANGASDTSRSPAVIFGGVLAQSTGVSSAASSSSPASSVWSAPSSTMQPSYTNSGVGGQLDLTV